MHFLPIVLVEASKATGKSKKKGGGTKSNTPNSNNTGTSSKNNKQSQRRNRQQQHNLKKAMTYIEYLMTSNDALASTQQGYPLRKLMDVEGYVPAVFVFQMSGWLRVIEGKQQQQPGKNASAHPDTLPYALMWAGMQKYAKKASTKLELDVKNETVRIKGEDKPWKKWLFPNSEGGFGCPKWCKQYQQQQGRSQKNQQKQKHKRNAEIVAGNTSRATSDTSSTASQSSGDEPCNDNTTVDNQVDTVQVGSQQ